MKKFLLLLVVGMAVTLGFHPGVSVSADMFDTLREKYLEYPEKVDSCALQSTTYGGNTYYWWRCDYTYNDVNAVSLTLDIPPENGLSLDDSNGAITSQLIIYDDENTAISTTDLADVFPGGVPAGGEVTFWFSNLDGDDVRGEGVKYRINIACDFSSVPGGNYMGSFIEQIEFLLSTYAVKVLFYDVGTIVSAQSVYHTLPVIPTEPDKAGYVFSGWVDKNGDLFSFSQPIPPDLVVDEVGELVLYSTYLSLTDEDILPDVTNPNIPAFLSSFLGVFNGDNTTGYTLFYALCTIILVGGMLYFHAPAFGIVMAHAILTVAFVLMGMLEFFIVMGVILIYAIVFIKKSRAPDYDEGA